MKRMLLRIFSLTVMLVTLALSLVFDVQLPVFTPRARSTSA